MNSLPESLDCGWYLSDYWCFIDVDDKLNYVSLEKKEMRAAKMTALSSMKLIVPPIEQVAWLLQVEQDKAVKKVIKRLTIDHKQLSLSMQEADDYFQEKFKS